MKQINEGASSVLIFFIQLSWFCEIFLIFGYMVMEFLNNKSLLGIASSDSYGLSLVGIPLLISIVWGAYLYSGKSKGHSWKFIFILNCCLVISSYFIFVFLPTSSLNISPTTSSLSYISWLIYFSLLLVYGVSIIQLQPQLFECNWLKSKSSIIVLIATISLFILLIGSLFSPIVYLLISFGIHSGLLPIIMILHHDKPINIQRRIWSQDLKKSLNVSSSLAIAEKILLVGLMGLSISILWMLYTPQSEGDTQIYPEFIQAGLFSIPFICGVILLAMLPSRFTTLACLSVLTLTSIISLIPLLWGNSIILFLIGAISVLIGKKMWTLNPVAVAVSIDFFLLCCYGASLFIQWKSGLIPSNPYYSIVQMVITVFMGVVIATWIVATCIFYLPKNVNEISKPKGEELHV